MLAGEARVRAKPFSQFHHNKKAGQLRVGRFGPA